MTIEVIRGKVSQKHLTQLANETYGDFVKVVVDVKRGIMAVGGELHSDEEAVLLDDGSRQEDLWGANIYPNRPSGQQIEYTSLINIRLGQGNRSQQIQSEEIRNRVRDVINSLTDIA